MANAFGLAKPSDHIIEVWEAIFPYQLDVAKPSSQRASHGD